MARRFVMYRCGGKRPVGKPPTAARLRRDQIADYLLELVRTEPKMEAAITKAARHFGVHPNTAWNVWRNASRSLLKQTGIGSSACRRANLLSLNLGRWFPCQRCRPNNYL
jgi:hypothetical protein